MICIKKSNFTILGQVSFGLINEIVNIDKIYQLLYFYSCYIIVLRTFVWGENHGKDLY